MSFSMNLYYKGGNGSARAFAQEMVSSGIVDKIRRMDGCMRYEYFVSLSDPEMVLLIDTWRDQKALDEYHLSPLMGVVARLREKYDLHIKAERYTENCMPDGDRPFLRIL